MAVKKLTKRTADEAKPGAKPYVIFDIDLAGFGLRVMPSGRKTWIVEYRPAGGGRRASTRRMSLGSDATLTADQARQAARSLLAEVRLGADPARKRQADRAKPMLSELADRFEAEYCRPPHLKPRTARLYSSNLRLYIRPALGSLKIDEITSTDITRLHRRIGKSHPTSANNAIVTVASLYKFACAEGLLPKGFNPASDVKHFKTEAVERYLSGTELARLGEALREFETSGLPWALNDKLSAEKAKHRPSKPENLIVVIPPDVAAAIRLLIFTGCRKSEILELQWSEVDFDRGLLHLSDIKTGRRVVVLNAPALEVLSQLPRVGSFVFPGNSAETNRGDISSFWYRLRKRAALDGSDGSQPVRLHDLRHNFASFGASGGMGLPIVGKLLGHSNPRTTARYAHLDADPVKRAAERIGAEIAGHFEAKATTNSPIAKFSPSGRPR